MLSLTEKLALLPNKELNEYYQNYLNLDSSEVSERADSKYSLLHAYLSFLKRANFDNNHSIIKKLVEKYPFDLTVKTFFAESYINQEKYEEANLILSDMIQKNPYFSAGHIQYIQLLVFQGKPQSAKEYTNNLKEKITISHKLEKRIEDILSISPQRYRLHSLIKTNFEMPDDHVNLPDFSKSLFMRLNPYGSFFLTGSSVLDLLDDREGTQGLVGISDMDFAGLLNEKMTKKELISAGFQETPLPNLYHCLFKDKESGRKVRIQLYVMNEAILNHSQFIEEDYVHRDFTISSLYCDDHGNIYDPTHRGLRHHKEKRLAYIQPDAIHSLKFNLKQTLRAIKYIARGFTPSTAIERDLHNFKLNPAVLFNPEEYRSAINYLYSSDEGLKWLKHYNMTYKLDALKKSLGTKTTHTSNIEYSAPHTFFYDSNNNNLISLNDNNNNNRNEKDVMDNSKGM